MPGRRPAAVPCAKPIASGIPRSGVWLPPDWQLFPPSPEWSAALVGSRFYRISQLLSFYAYFSLLLLILLNNQK